MLQRDAAGLPLLPEPCADGSLPLLLIELKWNKILLVGITYDAQSKKHTCRIEKIDRLI